MKIDTRQFDKLVKEMKNIPDEAVKQAGAFFKASTPKDTGNARRNTRTDPSRKQIRAEYSYASRLDSGWSKQAPAGMSEPTIAKLDDIIDDIVGRL